MLQRRGRRRGRMFVCVGCLFHEIIFDRGVTEVTAAFRNFAIDSRRRIHFGNLAVMLQVSQGNIQKASGRLAQLVFIQDTEGFTSYLPKHQRQ